METKHVWLGVVLTMSVAGATFGDPPATGRFGLPYKENQSGPDINDNCGWRRDQYHMEWNSDINPATGKRINKYHMGEDWNGACGGDTDEGAPLLAIADGEVDFVDNSIVDGQGKRLYIKHSFPYALAKDESGIFTFNSVIFHLKDIISVTKAGAIMRKGARITRGELIGHLGRTGTRSPHLHWAGETDLTSNLLGKNPYQNPLTIAYALKYIAPSLVVDDRRDRFYRYVAVEDDWKTFTMIGNAPSSTMYVLRRGERKSLKNAIAAGWIPAEGVKYYSGGRWKHHDNVDENFFEDGKTYRLKALVSGVSFHIPVPGNNFRQDRARLDMIRAVEHVPAFKSIRIDPDGGAYPYVYDSSWDDDSRYEMHCMAFNIKYRDNTNGIAHACSIVLKSNPLYRHTTHWDPIGWQWTGWKRVDWNRLY